MSFKEVINSKEIVLVDFFATWCGPCKTMEPILKDVKGRVDDSVRIVKIDVDKNESVAAAFQVRSIPTLILFHNGEPVWQKAGVVQSSEIHRTIQSFQKNK